MINIKDKAKCSGCHACYNVCPINAIKMESDDEGFLYPSIDSKKCINCNKCDSVCPTIHRKINDKVPIAYACYNKNDDIRLVSSSGGVFTEMASYIIDNGGYVFGAAFDCNLNLCHQVINNKDDLAILRGAKYVQSKIGDTFLQVQQLLGKNELVYFSGTPCQIDGLLKFLNRDYNNLICQDIICHGVPSPIIWQKYIKENGFNSNDKINFRDKSTGWETYSFKIQGEHNLKELAINNLYMNVFLSDLCLRPSCYECCSKSLCKNSDITLGDFWGIDNVIKNMNDHKGTSLVIINSNKGENFFKNIKNNFLLKEVKVNEAIKYNSSAIKSSHKPDKRDAFFKDIQTNELSVSFKKHRKRKKLIQKISLMKQTIIKGGRK